MIKRPALPALAMVIASQSTIAFACDRSAVEIETTSGSQIIRVEIADDTKERAQGLSGRETLAAGTGMLFVYDTPHRALFWMLGTKIALDMIFIESDGRISAIRRDVQPGTIWPVSGGRNVTAVLEINAGEAEQRNIRAGGHMQHPAFGC